MHSVEPIETPITRLPDLGGPANAYALTFDDGPEDPWTGAVLDVLESAGIPATFFVLGAKIDGNECLLRRMADLGCGIEVHAWQHLRMTQQAPAQVANDINRTRQLIFDVTGQMPQFVRPPHGTVSPAVLEQIRLVGMAPAFWSLHAWDWNRPGVEAIVADVAEGLSDGAVVLLHDGGGDRAQTVAAVARIVQIGDARGLTAVGLAAPAIMRW